MPKPKKDPNAPLPIPEDAFVRAAKLKELKVAPKAPKGFLTAEDWCIPPAFHSEPVFRPIIQYWKQCATVYYVERDMKVPSRMVTYDSEATIKKTHTRKEIQELQKFLKSSVKSATKRTGQFLKQLEKKEAKHMKREKLLKDIADGDKLMNDELRSARRFVDAQQLFNKKYMTGSKLGEAAPKKNALIVLELSDKQATWADEAKDEVVKLLNTVIADGPCESLNVMTFSVSGQTLWQPQFQPKTDPKKGLADSIKWISKNFSAKTCVPHSSPGDWLGMLEKCAGEGVQIPWRIFLCCTRAPEGSTDDVLERVRGFREALQPPAKGEPVLPINVVAFDPTIVGDDAEKAFFDELAGPSGSFAIDTSAEDLVALDRMLKAVGVRKKQLDKMNKKLLKMEDFSDRVLEDRNLLETQIALQRMLENDYEIVNDALNREQITESPEI